MSSTAKAAPVHLPLRVILILAVCACSLAVHFLAEGLVPAQGQFMLELFGQGGEVHSVHEHSEDHFVFSLQGSFPVARLFMPAPALAEARSCSVLISPLLPPPNS